jgi:hypothetical protein
MNLVIGGKVVSIDNEVLSKALEDKAEEVQVEFDGKIRTNEEEESFLKNLKKETVKTAMEMEVKKHRNEMGLEFEGKTFDNLFEAITSKNKAEFTKAPSEQLASKEADIKTLQSKISELTSSNESLTGKFTEYKNNISLESTLGKMIPKNSILPREDMITLMKNKINHGFDEEGNLFFKNQQGEALKDDQLNYLGADKVGENFFSNNPSYLKGVDGGSGGADSKGGSNPNSMESFNSKMTANGINIGSIEYNQAMNAAVVSGELKV